MPWTWYISNDMQFYVIAMALLTLSTIYFYSAVMILGAILIGSIFLSGYVLYIYEIVPTMVFDEHANNVGIKLYVAPWTRVTPYIFGIITGYILTKSKNYLSRNRKIIMWCWFLINVCFGFLSFFLYKRQMIILFTAMLFALHKIFVIGHFAWIIMYLNKYEGIKEFLLLKTWVPLSRLTYCAYLVHPIIMRFVCLFGETAFHYEILPSIVMGVGYIVISYVCSYVLSVMVEIPYVLLMRMFIQSRNASKYKKLDRKIS